MSLRRGQALYDACATITSIQKQPPGPLLAPFRHGLALRKSSSIYFVSEERNRDIPTSMFTFSLSLRY
jgi:hypothetical protein